MEKYPIEIVRDSEINARFISKSAGISLPTYLVMRENSSMRQSTEVGKRYKSHASRTDKRQQTNST